MTVPYPVVAAIDFGTHGTGYAWTQVLDDLDATLQQKPIYQDTWPGMPTVYPKDLSAVLLDPNGDVTMWGHEARKEWARLSAGGHDAGFGYASAFKMALKADSYRGVKAPGAGSVVIDSVDKAYPLVVSYLRRIYQMALKEIEGSGYLENQIRWCLTVPAIWDEEQKQLMRRAAREAGMPSDRDRLLLALEPEAAAVYCRVHLARVLGSRQEEQSRLVTADTRFMVIDCGGGTVDITAFRVEAAPTGRERLVEIGRVSGGKLGSEYINEAFIEQVLQDRLGGPAVIERIRAQCPQALLELVDSWEAQKITAKVRPGGKGVEPGIDRVVYLSSIPGEIRELLSPETIERLGTLPNGSRHRIAVTPEESKRLFDSVIDRLMELVEQELDQMIADNGPQAGPERLLLVGGLSTSEYLQERMSSHFGKRATLLLPPSPGGAVLFGAVLFGCDPPVIKSRRSRYTYGCDSAELFDPALDQGRGTTIHEDGSTYCTERFSVFVNIGRTVEVDETVTFGYSPLWSGQQRITFNFYQTLQANPRHIDEASCKKTGKFTIELGDSMKQPFENRSVAVEMKFGDTDISVSGINTYTGERARTTLDFHSGG